MLVLSRGRNEKIVFPQLDITVEILQLASNKVRIGVKAPKDIEVLRDELVQQENPQRSRTKPHRLTHALRNRLHTAQLALQLSQKLLANDRFEQADRALQQALSEFEAVDNELSGGVPDPIRRALVVEDNANESELLAAYLRASGFQVDTANNGQQAMNMLRGGELPDVLLLDMRMPVCDGPCMLKQLREDPRFDELPVFAVTGSELDEVQAETADNRVDRWFQKPVKAEVLVREMKKALAEIPAVAN